MCASAIQVWNPEFTTGTRVFETWRKVEANLHRLLDSEIPRVRDTHAVLIERMGIASTRWLRKQKVSIATATDLREYFDAETQCEDLKSAKKATMVIPKVAKPAIFK